MPPRTKSPCSGTRKADCLKLVDECSWIVGKGCRRLSTSVNAQRNTRPRAPVANTSNHDAARKVLLGNNGLTLGKVYPNNSSRFLRDLNYVKSYVTPQGEFIAKISFTCKLSNDNKYLHFNNGEFSVGHKKNGGKRYTKYVTFSIGFNYDADSPKGQTIHSLGMFLDRAMPPIPHNLLNEFLPLMRSMHVIIPRVHNSNERQLFMLGVPKKEQPVAPLRIMPLSDDVAKWLDHMILEAEKGFKGNKEYYVEDRRWTWLGAVYPEGFKAK